jgi:hypothetical protein
MPPASTLPSPSEPTTSTTSDGGAEGDRATTETTSTATTIGTTATTDTATSAPPTSATSAPGTAPDGGAVAQESLEPAIISVDELTARLGGTWSQFIDRFDESGPGSEPAPCGLDVLEVPGSIYVDNEDEGTTDLAGIDESSDAFVPAREFEQIIAPGAGPAVVEAFRRIRECEEFATEFEGDVRIDGADIDGATDAVSVETTEGTMTLYWYFADFGGTSIGVFFVGQDNDLGGVIGELIAAAGSRL